MSEDHIHLDRLAILLVEPSGFLASLVRSVLRAFEIRTVLVAAAGHDGVSTLETAAMQPEAVGVGAIDLVITELLLPDIDGFALLRWVRTSDQSPDHFMPLLALTAAADSENVERARDHGVTEFMVKPFSAQSLANHLIRTIVQPRQFVLSPGYFGPDRRRQRLPVKADRRETRDDEIEIIHTASSPSQLNLERKVTYFRIVNRLKDKVGAFRPGAVPTINPGLIEAAQQHIHEKAGDYADWSQHSIRELERAVEMLERGAGSTPRLLGQINRIAHEFRGQGGIFGYPLMTEFGRSLYEATMDRSIEVTANVVKLIDAHVDTLKIVMHQKIKGDGGQVGRDLLDSLAQAKRKYRGRRGGTVSRTPRRPGSEPSPGRPDSQP